jgi:hypothetical protein
MVVPFEPGSTLAAMNRVLSAVFREPSRRVPRDGESAGSGAPSSPPLSARDEAQELLREGAVLSQQTLDSKICTHEGGCVENMLWRALKIGAGGFVAKALLEATVTLVRKKSLQAAIPALFRKDTARFAAFLAAMVGTASGVRCLLIWLRGRDDRLNAAASGALAGLTCLLDSPARRQGIALYLLVRALYALLHALMRRRYISRIPHASTLTFSAANALIIYSFICEPHLLDRGYYNWILKTGNVTGQLISYTMREPRLGIHTGKPGVVPTPPGCTHPDHSVIHPRSISPSGFDTLSGMIEVASLLAAAAGVRPSEAPRLEEEENDGVLSYHEAINLQGESEQPMKGIFPEFSASPLGPTDRVHSSPPTTKDGSVLAVGTGGYHYGFQSTSRTVREATGVDFMSAKGWGDHLAGRQLRSGGGGSSAIHRLNKAAELGVKELWKSPPPVSELHDSPNKCPPLKLTSEGIEKVWRAALPPESKNKPLPSASELATIQSLLHQAPPRSILPGVEVGPTFFRRCDEVYHPGQSCAVAHGSDIPALMMRGYRLYIPVHLVPLLMFRWKSLASDPVGVLSKAAVDITRSSLFLTLYTSLVKSTLCFLRNLREADDGWQAAAAGFVSGLALSVEQEKRGKELMLYCLPKGIEVGWQLLERQGWVRRVPFGNVLMISAALAIVLALDRADLSSSYASLVNLLFGSEEPFFVSSPPRHLRTLPSPPLPPRANPLRGREVPTITLDRVPEASDDGASSTSGSAHPSE